jgi:hypothetical protein
MNCNITDVEMFDIIKTNFTNELYEWMKIEFSDKCSNGDLCINELLDDLNSMYNIKNKVEIPIDIKFINYIYDRYINNYLKGENPDPFWAD